ncbi:hypothetical protein SHLO109777_02970 [Shewanella loihica]
MRLLGYVQHKFSKLENLRRNKVYNSLNLTIDFNNENRGEV